GAAGTTGTAGATGAAGSGGGCVATKTIAGAQATVTCPATDTAVEGYVTPTCDFTYSLAPNNIFTGPVTLVSHLTRGFAAFDINPLGDGRIQLMCFYVDPNLRGIGGISEFIVASSCTATSASTFTCTK
ncbi:MAG: hypothetical protein JWM82_213, partial [Myxococcales bacterium]|nr:hypothetical protein [Myxococcales bacterium]